MNIKKQLENDLKALKNQLEALRQQYNNTQGAINYNIDVTNRIVALEKQEKEDAKKKIKEALKKEKKEGNKK